MQIYTITAENSKLFSAMLPPQIELSLNGPLYFALAATQEENAQDFALGTIAFEIVETSDGEDVAAVIRWLHVTEEFRHGGVATTLMVAMLNIIAKAGVFNIICDIPLNEEYDSLCLYLENFGFEFQFSETFEVMIPMKRVAQFAKRLPNKIRADIHPITKASAKEFAEFIQEMKKIPEVLIDLPEEIDGYDDAASSISLNESGRITGALLMGESSDGVPTVLLLRLRDGDRRLLSGLITYSAKKAVISYPPNEDVRVVCRYQGAATILKSLFPELEFALVRRGYLNSAQED